MRLRGLAGGHLARLLALLLLVLSSFHSTTAAGATTSSLRAEAGAFADVPNTDFAPVLEMVPSEDGTEMLISASGVGQIGGTLFANIELGPGHRKGSYTVPYSDTAEAYVLTAPGFTPEVDTSAPLFITTTTGLESEPVEFVRAYVPLGGTPTINATDGHLQVTVVHSDTFEADAYVALVPSYAPPGPLPQGYRLVGSTFSVRASGAIVAGEQPMSIRMAYDDITLGNADPHMLAIFIWNASTKEWEEVESTLFSQQRYLAAASARFGFYALMVKTTWADQFSDFSGLDIEELSNVTFGGIPGDRTLILNGTAQEGIAASQLITPPAPLEQWGTIVYTASVSTPVTSITVDVLDADGNLLLADVASGASLAAIDPVEHPALRLRATLRTTEEGQTPALEGWQISWTVPLPKGVQMHLPYLLGNEVASRAADDAVP